MADVMTILSGISYADMLKMSLKELNQWHDRAIKRAGVKYD